MRTVRREERNTRNTQLGEVGGRAASSNPIGDADTPSQERLGQVINRAPKQKSADEQRRESKEGMGHGPDGIKHQHHCAEPGCGSMDQTCA